MADNRTQSTLPFGVLPRPLMTIGIDPTVDFACKRVLGSLEHPAITLHFLKNPSGE